MSRTFKSLLAAILVSGFVASPAFARSTVETVSIAVSYADLDLSQTADAKDMMSRIKTGARKVCNELSSAHAAGETRWLRICRQELADKAVAEIGSPVLTALYYGRRATQFAAR